MVRFTIILQDRRMGWIPSADCRLETVYAKLVITTAAHVWATYLFIHNHQVEFKLYLKNAQPSMRVFRISCGVWAGLWIDSLLSTTISPVWWIITDQWNDTSHWFYSTVAHRQYYKVLPDWKLLIWISFSLFSKKALTNGISSVGMYDRICSYCYLR